MHLGYWNSCNPMNRMAHLNWKGTIRMKYSPRLKETIISIFHNRNSRISIHVIFTKSGFWFSKMLQMLHLVRVSVVKDDFFAHWWIFYASYGHMRYSTRLFLVLEISFLTKFCFCRNNAFNLLAAVPNWFRSDQRLNFSWKYEAVGSIPPEIRSTKMSIPVWSGSGV